MLQVPCVMSEAGLWMLRSRVVPLVVSRAVSPRTVCCVSSRAIDTVSRVSLLGSRVVDAASSVSCLSSSTVDAVSSRCVVVGCLI